MDETIQVLREVEGRDFGASKLIRLVGGCDAAKLRCGLGATGAFLQVLLLSLYSAGSLAGGWAGAVHGASGAAGR